MHASPLWIHHRRLTFRLCALLIILTVFLTAPHLANLSRQAAPAIAASFSHREPMKVESALPFTMKEVEEYFIQATGLQPLRTSDGALFRSGNGAEDSHFYQVELRQKGAGISVTVAYTSDYGLSVAREFFEAPFFQREETRLFYQMLERAGRSPTAVLHRFMVTFRPTQDGKINELQMIFEPEPPRLARP